MIVFDISNRIYEVESEADDVIEGIDKLKESFFKTATFIVDLFGFEPKLGCPFHEALVIVIECDVEFAFSMGEKSDVFQCLVHVTGVVEYSPRIDNIVCAK